MLIISGLTDRKLCNDKNNVVYQQSIGKFYLFAMQTYRELKSYKVISNYLWIILDTLSTVYAAGGNHVKHQSSKFLFVKYKI